MKPNFVPLNKDQHKGKRLISQVDFARFDNLNSTSIVPQEFAFASVELPIVFVKANEDDFACVLLLGNNEPKNHYIKDGKPRGRYVPASFTHFPLGMTRNPDDQNKVMILIDEDCELLNDDKGDQLFNEDGTESDYLKQRANAMFNYYNSGQAMREFSKALQENDLLIPQGIEFGKEGKKNKIQGFFVVDEKKLNELSDETYLEFRKKGYLPLIYAHLVSVNNMPKLASYIGVE